jgi:tRNA(Glu) U13 pseudouridine synthase TruD
MIERDLVVLALHGYQSYLFNRLAAICLSKLLQTLRLPPLESLAFKYGELLFYKELPETVFAKVKNSLLPVPGHDTRCADQLVAQALEAALAEESIGLSDLKVKKLPGKAVRGIERPLTIVTSAATR